MELGHLSTLIRGPLTKRDAAQYVAITTEGRNEGSIGVVVTLDVPMEHLMGGGQEGWSVDSRSCTRFPLAPFSVSVLHPRGSSPCSQTADFGEGGSGLRLQ